MARILSWNVNGVRAALAKGAFAPLAELNPDVICIQEVRARADQVGQLIAELPHQYFAHALRPGYSGTAILSRTPALSWREGMGDKLSDEEGRVVTAEFPSLFVVSVYAVNSQRGLPRLPLRLAWDESFRRYARGLARTKPVLLTGDMNVAHDEIDLARPNDNHMNAGFTDEERASFGRLLQAGFIDTFRALHDEGERYTWWSQVTRARLRNIGWRIDYVCISEALRGRLRQASIYETIMGSDHCPVGIDLEGDL